MSLFYSGADWTWINWEPLPEWLAAGLSLWCVWLAAKNRILNWPIAMLASCLYAYVFYAAGLVSDAVLQGVFLGFQAYGWRQWSSPGKGPLPISIGPRRILVLTLVLAALVYPIWVQAVSHLKPDASFIWVDAALTLLSISALFWQSRRFIQNWYLWVLVDVVYVPMYHINGQTVTAVLYALFLLLCLNGYRSWKAELAHP
jgi:nicotinamide mononucleotide transporter